MDHPSVLYLMNKESSTLGEVAFSLKTFKPSIEKRLYIIEKEGVGRKSNS